MKEEELEKQKKKKKKNNLFHVCLGAGHRGWLEGGREERVFLGVVRY